MGRRFEESGVSKRGLPYPSIGDVVTFEDLGPCRLVDRWDDPDGLTETRVYVHLDG